MLSGVASAVGDVLLENGIKVLGSTVKGTTELGLRKLGDFVKDQTGIELFDGSIVNNGLNAEQTIALKKLELEHEQKLKEFETEFAKAIMGDIDSARVMQNTALQSQTAGWLARNFIYIFAIFWSVFAATFLFTVTFIDVPPENQRNVDTVLGFLLGTVITTIIGFFFGNSFRLSKTNEAASAALISANSKKE